MHSGLIGLIEYGALVGVVLLLAVFELVALRRSQARDRRMRKGRSKRTHGD